MDEIKLTTLKQIEHPKGNIFHGLKKSDESYVDFGEAYFSFVNQSEIKGWKKHTKMTLNIIVPIGAIQFVIFDESKNEFFSVTLGRDNYQRLTVQPGVWVAFKGIEKENMLLNLASIEHDPSEAINKDLGEIKYEW